jgi:hypothetical protein
MKNCWIFCGLPFSNSVRFSASRWDEIAVLVENHRVDLDELRWST